MMVFILGDKSCGVSTTVISHDNYSGYIEVECDIQ